jgi:hypothetical protein
LWCCTERPGCLTIDIRECPIFWSPFCDTTEAACAQSDELVVSGLETGWGPAGRIEVQVHAQPLRRLAPEFSLGANKVRSQQKWGTFRRWHAEGESDPERLVGRAEILQRSGLLLGPRQSAMLPLWLSGRVLRLQGLLRRCCRELQKSSGVARATANGWMFGLAADRLCFLGRTDRTGGEAADHKALNVRTDIAPSD